jgi:hypothetical protein
VPCRIGTSAGFLEEEFPVVRGEATSGPVCSCVLPPVIEEANVVILLLQWLDLSFDEIVQLAEILLNVVWDVEVHVLPLSRFCGPAVPPEPRFCRSHRLQDSRNT